MNIILHGTGAGTPSGNRGASSATFRFDSGDVLLVDAGEGCSRAMIRDGRNLHEITTVVVSHMHVDHWTGLPNLVMAWIIGGREAPVDLYLPPRSLNFFRSILSNSWMLQKRLPFDLRLRELQPLQLPEEWSLRPFRTSHLDKFIGTEEADILSFPSFGFVLESGGRKILFSQDIGSEQDLDGEILGTELLICESAHVNLSHIVERARDAGVSRLIFTHIPPEREGAFEKITLDGGGLDWSVAEDGLIIPL
ncbi:MAG: MBL fold metallo-hydrolase [Candidatus Kapaibacterium sp.]